MAVVLVCYFSDYNSFRIICLCMSRWCIIVKIVLCIVYKEFDNRPFDLTVQASLVRLRRLRWCTISIVCIIYELGQYLTILSNNLGEIVLQVSWRSLTEMFVWYITCHESDI